MEKSFRHINLWKKYKSEKNLTKIIKLETKLAELYYPLVKKTAYRLAEKLNWKLTPDELSSFGVDGLYIAMRKFDIERGFKFETYATPRIYGSMIDEIRREDIIPRTVRINNNLFEKTRNILEFEKGRKATDIEIIKRMGLNEKEYFRHMKKYNPVAFISIQGMGSNPGNEDMKESFNINLIDRDSKSPDTNIKKSEFFNKLLSKNFSKLERKIIYLYYYENLTMDLIGEYLNMSESRISQIHRDILPRLKKKIERNPIYFSGDIFSFISCNNKKFSV